MIISASGWRGVFAANGDEESPAPEITGPHRIITSAAAKAFSVYTKNIGRTGCIIAGRDTRPTGGAIATAVIDGLIAEGREVLYPGITAAPEIMAYTRSLGAAGFIYISASHNPIGHNGLKFGLADGGVLPGPEAAVLAETFINILNTENVARPPISAEQAGRVYSLGPRYKEEAKRAYFDFTAEVITGRPDTGGAEKTLAALRAGLKETPLGIAADFNGSARAVSIDRDFFTWLGTGFKAINDKCGEIAHAIVPEGASLDACRDFLGAVHKGDPSFVLGYVPDCDGDRGNLVIYDEGGGCFRPLEAQEVFALACIAELAYLVWAGELKYDEEGNCLVKAALVVNDPTSMRIDRIASAFKIPVFRAETGEANVVGLARKLREEGWLVRILGEGSNGGNITHPSSVRDPIDTVCAILKLLCIRSTPEKKGLYEIWCRLKGRMETYRKDFSFADIIASMPCFVTTGAFSKEAAIKVKLEDQSLLKDRYQEVFLREWEEKKGWLKKRYGIAGWEISAYNGMSEKRGVPRFGEAGKGGLKIVFINNEGQRIASIWMRGSATEPVLRIIADAEGSDQSFEQYLLGWQRGMIKEAGCSPQQFQN
ncbi:MAG: phosphatidylglycerol lysyltransferase [Treponema sp.]|nr:phosphatidylglycerol lysyltransferase [Treponema sp.]